MKYVLLFVGTMEDQKQFESQSTEETQKAMGGAMNWFESYSRAGKIVGGEQLKGPDTVTTTATVTPAVPLVPGESYDLVAGTGITDVMGNAIAAGLDVREAVA